nr:MAG TPA: hypothetical protein [Bacteriophage sp.]
MVQNYFTPLPPLCAQGHILLRPSGQLSRPLL